MPEDREPDAPDMPHADTHTPLHGPIPEACLPTRHSPTANSAPPAQCIRLERGVRCGGLHCKATSQVTKV
eukprot:scaffold118_cov121-Isochrysis_galbana.AAC.1